MVSPRLTPKAEQKKENTFFFLPWGALLASLGSRGRFDVVNLGLFLSECLSGSCCRLCCGRSRGRGRGCRCPLARVPSLHLRVAPVPPLGLVVVLVMVVCPWLCLLTAI